MSKTLYVDGLTGRTAIMDGNLNLDAVANPYAHTDILYFHSSFNYLYYVNTFSGNATFPYLGGTISTGYVSNNSVLIGSMPWTSTKNPFVFSYINSIPSCGDIQWQKNNDVSFRLVGIVYEVVSNTLNIYAHEFAIAILTALASTTISVVSYVYTDTGDETGNTIASIEADHCYFENGKFDSEKKYCTATSGTFPLRQSGQITLSGNSFTFVNSSAVNIGVI